MRPPTADPTWGVQIWMDSGYWICVIRLTG